MEQSEEDGDPGGRSTDSSWAYYDNSSLLYNYSICVLDNELTSPYFQTAVYVCYMSVLVLSLGGNGLVCYVVYASPRMWTVTNYFIVNLAVGDVLLTLLCVPFSFVPTLLLQRWPFGTGLCRTVSFSQATSVLVSAYTLVAISLDRYVAIRWPLRPRLAKRHAKVVISSVWAVAVLSAAPIALYSTLTQPSDWYRECGFFICEERWPSADDKYYYSMALMVLQYLVPFTVLVITYTLIATVVWGQRTPGEAQNARDQRVARSKRKMVKMMVTVVIVFTVCWLPYNLLMVAFDHDSSLPEWPLLPYLYFACHWLAMSHSCYNPVIYCWMNARFRSGFQLALVHVPLLRRVLRSAGRGGSGGGRPGRPGSLAAMALAGMDGSDGCGSTALNRGATASSWTSVKRFPTRTARAAAPCADTGPAPARSTSQRVSFAAPAAPAEKVPV